MPFLRHTFGVHNGGVPLAQDVTVTDETAPPFEVEVPAETTLAVAIAFPSAALSSIFARTSKADGSAATLQLRTNDPVSYSTTGNLITLSSGAPLSWLSNSGIPNPFTVDVTSWHLVNLSAAPVKVAGFYSADITP